jgi:hypothetical protein
MAGLRYVLDSDSFQKAFPPTIPVPSLLVKFAAWLGEQDVDLGGFKLVSRRLNDLDLSGQGDLYSCFAPFQWTLCGSVAALWLPEGVPLASPPVVLLGSEGKNLLLGDSLSNFFWRLARGTTGDRDLDFRDERNTDGGPVLSNWLTLQGVQPAPLVSWPDFAAWWRERQQAHEAWCDSDPLCLEIAARLRRVWPFAEGAKRWPSHAFDAVMVGTRFEMWQRSRGPQPLAPGAVADLEPLLRADRERRARKVPERGVWFQSWIKVGATGGARVNGDFIGRPKVGDRVVPIPLQAFREDLAAFPRSAYWMPEWLGSGLVR